jgi:hypothetical protein
VAVEARSCRLTAPAWLAWQLGGAEALWSGLLRSDVLAQRQGYRELGFMRTNVRLPVCQDCEARLELLVTNDLYRLVVRGGCLQLRNRVRHYRHCGSLASRPSPAGAESDCARTACGL